MASSTRERILDVMVRVAVLLALVTTACVFDRAKDRPTRLRIGAATRELASPSAPPPVLRQVVQTQEPPALTGAQTGVGQFTQRFLGVLYAGGELETGRMNVASSNFAGAYGVVGMEQAVGPGSLGLELVAGWRGLRVGSLENEQNFFVAEPRVRGELWIGEQFTLGAALGTTLDQRGSWMLGVNLGIHSSAFGR